ncbi:MAG: hypothetical protein EHM41_08630 [Chloroflexi bacterium]|nr:MAG: hypothetical protein EHM41_08630 [Chloroflexota bacterium]
MKNPPLKDNDKAFLRKAMENLLVPAEWNTLDFESLSGLVLLIGAKDSGKSTLSYFLYNHLVRSGKRCAFIDGDPGQTTFGPPGTITLVMGAEFPKLESTDRLSPDLDSYFVRRSFIGSTTPRGHMIPLLIGAERLRAASKQEEADVVIFDTCGLVDPEQGGLSLKHGLVELLQPDTIIAIQENDELELILRPLKRSKRTKILQLKPSQSARQRNQAIRQNHRRDQFEAYFRSAVTLEIQTSKYPIFPFPRFILNGLVSFEDVNGFSLALGIVHKIDRRAHQIGVLMPISELSDVDAIRLGDLTVDPVTFQDKLVR